MPEGDTVWLTARRLGAALSGAALTRAELRVPRFVTTELAGRTVAGVSSRGKHILMRLAGDLTLHTHLGMEGSWRLLRGGARWPGPREPVRAVLANPRTLAVGYRLARLDVVHTTAEHQLVGHLGPDLLGRDWDADEAVRRLAAAPGRPIGEALLDQRVLAGIGNVYRAELLFLRGLHPSTRVGDVADLDRLVRLAREVLVTNRERPGHVTTGDPRRGHQHWVYNRRGEACRRCGTLIEYAASGEPARQRSVWWCPSCQPVPAP